MDITAVTTDSIEQTLLDGEAIIARVRAAQMRLVREIDRRQTPLADGCRSLAEWVTGRLDIAPDTATTLVTAARRCEALPIVESALANGTVTYDRMVAAARIAKPCEDGTILDEVAGYDVAGIQRLSSRRHRISTGKERESFERRYVAVQANLDESSWRVHGELPAVAGRVFVDALDHKADIVQPEPDHLVTRGMRWADALWAISLDALTGSDGANIDTHTPLVTVFVDATDAAPTNGEAGIVLEAGPQIGPSALEGILCDAIVEVTATTNDGVPLAYGRRSRTIPPRLRRAILHRDGGVCTIEGCVSSYRLQIHHITAWADGGRTDADNLTTLCWFHHNVAIHGQGFTINPDSPPHRRTLNRPPIHSPP